MFTRSPMHNPIPPRFQRRAPVSRLPFGYDNLPPPREVPEEDDIFTDEKVEQLERNYQELRENELRKRVESFVKEKRETEMSERSQYEQRLRPEPWRENVEEEVEEEEEELKPIEVDRPAPFFNSPRRTSSLSPPSRGFAQTMTKERYFSEISPVRHIKDAPNSFDNVLKRSPNVSRLLSNYQQKQTQKERARPSSRLRTVSINNSDEPFEDRDLNTSHIVDFAKSGFKALHRIVVIALKMAHILVGPLLSPKVVWILPAIIAVCASLYGVSYGLSYVVSGLASTGSGAGYSSPPAEPPQDISEVTARLLPLESHVYALSQKFAAFEPWVKNMVQTTDQRVSRLEEKLHDELTKVSEALGTLNHKIDKFTDWADTVDVAVQRHDDGLEKLQRIVSSQADDFNEMFERLNANQDLDSKYVSFEQFEEFESRIARQLADERNVLSGLIDRVDLKLNSIEHTNPEIDETVVSTLRQELQQQLSGQLADLDTKFEKSQVRTNELLAAQGGSIVDLNRRLQDVVSGSGPSLGSKDNQPHSPVSRMERPNFLDPNIGARVDRSLTSTPFNPYTRSSLPYRAVRDVMGFLGFGRVHFNTADMALYSGTEVGNCWPFQGKTGTLAVEMPCPVLVDSVAVEHPYYKQLVDPRTAPRTVSLWGRVDDPKLRKEVQLIVRGDTEKAELPDNFVKLASFEYDLYKGEQWQLFEIPREVQRLEIPVRHVIFKFESNWGSSRVSCVYRVQLFGNQAGSLRFDDYGNIKGNDGELNQGESGNSVLADKIVISHDTGFGDDEEF